MNITILSGGSGNDSLIKGIVNIYPKAKIKIITNAYDCGKSTGVCREITRTLGVSDIRKNHLRMYLCVKNKHNPNLIYFYTNRYNLPKGDEEFFVKNLLDYFNLPFLKEYVCRFFRSATDEYIFDNFSIANIVYSQMYKEHGYEYTNNFFCQLLGIEDCVILNSFDNTYIYAVTENGLKLGEDKIVEWCNKEDKIRKIEYSNSLHNVNQKAIDEIYNSDLIIISSGTFWSSIYPTLEYGELYKHINNSKAKKIMVMNNDEDKDCFGVGSNDILSLLVELGLDMNLFKIIENKDAVLSMRQESNKYKITYSHLGNYNGAHDSHLLAKAIFKEYYELYDEYLVLIDFDGTIWGRDYIVDDDILNTSKENVKLSNSAKFIVVSGNNYNSISSKISQVGLSNVNFSLWCDANSINYKNDEIIDVINQFVIGGVKTNICVYVHEKYGLIASTNNDYYTTCLKIKPLYGSLRNEICADINNYISNVLHNYEVVAKITGNTTIDIVSTRNNKCEILSKICTGDRKTLYIGDECYNGNDMEISNCCDKYINVNDVFETNLILKLL